MVSGHGGGAPNLGRVPYPQTALTDRLDLRPVDPVADLEALSRLFADPEGWWYEPAGRHTNVGTSRRWLERAAERWTSDGLSYWAARLRADGTVLGVGGVQRHGSGTWNLFYRLDTAFWGHGYATELGNEAVRAAAAVDPSVPVIAWVLEHNAPSRRVAERVGLTDHGLRIDVNDGAARLAYADRPLDDTPLPRV
jgi:RimJ/RimL family protein N-acetyltransferase